MVLSRARWVSERLPLLTFWNESLFTLLDSAYPAAQDEFQVDRWGNFLVNFGCRVFGRKALFTPRWLRGLALA